ncbi:DUF805 domain-containing protein [Streptomyces sp. GQFP]|uniref:DUF805 domain-containing protein n=1 Tax=Streptomyces sp. GQFP TaxID=2907545 RepID=UPI001F2FD894|nr:DUF805 domain-containing protein [Streptomyces sp. GQFP]UIX31812.1 DUF805 domain-containing protein [Streptomyces sp. GQFP]
MNYFLDVLKKYAVFSGRARRKEYWMFVLFSVIISIALTIVDSFIGFPILSAVFSLGLLVPSLAVCVRRLHDTGRSAWWLLFGFVPLVGSITLLVFTCLDGEAGENKYGHSPKAVPAFA